MRRDVPVTPDARLKPGEYFVSFAAPDAVLDAFMRRADWREAAARYLAEWTGDRVAFAGGGVAWERTCPDCPPSRVFMVRVVVLDPELGPPMVYAGVSLRVLSAAVAAVLVGVVALSVVRVTQLVTDPERRPVADALPSPWRVLLYGAAVAAGVWLVREVWP